MPAENDRIADVLDDIASMLELLGENKFRVLAHQKVARALRDLTTPATGMTREELLAIDGIGAKQADKIAEYNETGVIAEHAELQEKVPGGLLAVLQIPGLGPKTVKAMWDELGVTDVASLKTALDGGKVETLPRMGAKSVARIRESLMFLESVGKRLPLGIVMPVAERLVGELGAVEGVERVAFAGSLRRGRETIGDIDILCVASVPERAHEALQKASNVVQVVAAGQTKTSVRVKLEHDFGRWRGLEEEAKANVQVDLRTVPSDAFGAAMMYFTGSKAHNVRVRERAQKQGLTLNEYGLFPADDEGTPPQQRGVAPVAGDAEDAVYARLGLPMIEPELREDRGETDTEPSELVRVESIVSELHAHTTESDGEMPLAELVDRARSRGFHTIAVTDHSKSSAVANGLDETRLRAQRDAVERLRDDLGDTIDVLCGSEVDILADGSLDFDDDVLFALDLVVASPHVALNQDGKTATARILRAIEHPAVHVIGHPTGRLLGRRAGMDLAMDDIITAAKEHDVALEVNSHWMRLDLRDTHVRAAAESGVKIAIDCDVHAPGDFDNIRYGVMTARRGWLPRQLCVNTWSRDELRRWVRSKRA